MRMTSMHSQQAWEDGPDSALLGRLQRAMDQVRVVEEKTDLSKVLLPVLEKLWNLLF